MTTDDLLEQLVKKVTGRLYCEEGCHSKGYVIWK